MERLSDGAIEEILSFRNRLIQETNAISFSSEHNTNIMEDRSFISFLDALNYTGFVENFDYVSWMQQRDQVNDMPGNMTEEVKNADMEELRKLITMHIRIERFSEGHIQKLYEKGFFTGFFDRLEELNNG